MAIADSSVHRSNDVFLPDIIMLTLYPTARRWLGSGFTLLIIMGTQLSSSSGVQQGVVLAIMS